MSEFAQEVCSDAHERMGRAVVHAQGHFSTIRTGRATPALVEKLKVNYYGADVPSAAVGWILGSGSQDFGDSALRPWVN